MDMENHHIDYLLLYSSLYSPPAKLAPFFKALRDYLFPDDTSIWTIASAPDVCARAFASSNELYCAVIRTAYMHLKMLNPQRTTNELLQFMQSECKVTDCNYFRNYLRYIQEAFPQKPFRNVPLLPGPTTKVMQSGPQMTRFVKYVINKTSQKNCRTDDVDIVMPQALKMYRDQQKYTDADRKELERQYKTASSLAEKIAVIFKESDQTYRIPAAYVRSKVSAVGVSEKVKTDIQNCIKSGANFIIIPVSIQLDLEDLTPDAIVKRIDRQGANYSLWNIISDGHQNTLILIPGTETAYRYEPNGTRILNDKLNEIFRVRLLSELGVSHYTYQTDLDVCPYLPGAQVLQDSLGTGGYCVAWTTMFISLLLLNPTWTIEEIQARMLNAGATFVPPDRKYERGKILLEYIQSFINAMDCILPPHYSDEELQDLGLLPVLCSPDHRLDRFDVIFVASSWSPVDNKDQRRVVAVRNLCGQFISNNVRTSLTEVTSGWEGLPEVDSPYAKVKQPSLYVMSHQELAKMDDSGETGKQVGTYEDPILLNDVQSWAQYDYSLRRALQTTSPSRELPACISRVVHLL